jgi:dTDP-4-amino-4,6-dideoxygalactose transaminase
MQNNQSTLKGAQPNVERPIYVTSPSLPPLEEFVSYVGAIWGSKQLTNGGAFHQQLEQALCDYLGVNYINLFSNGTIALITALKALDIKGEVITTPYSFVATAHALKWNDLTPVFADVDPETFNLAPEKIEAAITPATSAILPVHCYGRPCDVEAIAKIADRHKLHVIYDAAHAFGVKDDKGKSLLQYGDLSVLSFHATKVFSTFEGGAIVCHDLETKQRIDDLKNFGFANEVTVREVGINGKMSEIHAAFGLLSLKYIDSNLAARARVAEIYREGLVGVSGIRIPRVIPKDGIRNNAYFPILIEQEYPLARDELYQRLRDAGIYGRRYFYPLISDFPMYRGLPSARPNELSVADALAKSVICLPIYPDLREVEQQRILEILRKP